MLKIIYNIKLENSFYLFSYLGVFTTICYRQLGLLLATFFKLNECPIEHDIEQTLEK